MRPRSWLQVAIAALLVISVVSPGIAQGQPVIGQTYWGQNALNQIVTNWPAVAIVVLAAVLLLGVLGFYKLDGPRAVLLLTAIGFLVYVFYWQPLSQMLPR